jgi:heptosyltransferase I
MSLPLSAPPEHLCILRLSAIGDVTHVLPTLRTLQYHWPKTRIAWIIGKTEATLMNDIPDVEFIVFDKSKGWKAYCNLQRALKNRRFDVLLNMQASLRASLASLAVRAPIKLGYDKARARGLQWVFTNYKIRPHSRQHVLDSFLEFPRALGLGKSVIEWNIPIPQTARLLVQRTISQKQRILVINPCSSTRARNWRNWSVQSYADIIDYAAKRHGMRTVLTGGLGPQEKEYGKAISSKAMAKPINLIGQTTLKELLAVLDRADVVIAPDTGPAHMAGAVGTPVIGLYASSNPERTGPYLSRDITVNKYPQALQKEFGKGLDEVRWGQRVRNPRVMELITVQEVKDRLAQAVSSLEPF